MFDGGVLVESGVSVGVVCEFVACVVEEECDVAEALGEFADEEECGFDVVVV